MIWGYPRVWKPPLLWVQWEGPKLCNIAPWLKGRLRLCKNHKSKHCNENIVCLGTRTEPSSQTRELGCRILQTIASEIQWFQPDVEQVRHHSRHSRYTGHWTMHKAHWSWVNDLGSNGNREAKASQQDCGTTFQLPLWSPQVAMIHLSASGCQASTEAGPRLFPRRFKRRSLDGEGPCASIAAINAAIPARSTNKSNKQCQLQHPVFFCLQ